MKFWSWIALPLGLLLGTAGCVLFYEWQHPPDWGQNFLNLVVSGAFGGLANAFFSGSKRLVLPRLQEVEGNWEWEAGFLADLFIGVIGAIASLIFALALLNDKLFGATQGQSSEMFIPSWVRIIAFGALAGFAARQLLPNLSKRLSDMISEKVKDKVDQKTKDIVKTQGRNEAKIDLALLAAQTPESPQRHPTEVARDEAQTPIDQLKSLGVQYSAIRIADYNSRVAERERIANEMVDFSVRNRIDSHAISNSIATDRNKEMVLALATLIAKQPTAGDAHRLFSSYDLCLGTPAIRSKSKFILYRVLLALVSLNQRKLIAAAEIVSARAIAGDCLAIAEPSLQSRAQAVLDLLGE